MALVVRYYPGGYSAAAAQHNQAEQWDGGTGTYTAWDTQGAQTASRAFTAAESTQNSQIDGSSTASANQAALQAKAQTALTNNTTYLAIGSPTNAQVAAQVVALTKQVDALIKLTIQSLSDTSGT